MPRAHAPPPPVLNRATLDGLRAALGDDRAQALVCLFRGEMHRRVNAILRGLDAPPMVVREADALAGAARSVGLVALGASAEQLTEAARQGHTDAVVHATDALLRAVHEALAALRDAGYSPNSDSPATDPSPQDARLR
jgi:HPt (histidine-containing phosphotransfer) domain-containing protein